VSEPIEILLVEDSPEDLELTLHALREHNLTNHIRVARDGAEAVDALLGETSSLQPLPKLVLLDLKLPKLSGLEVLERIKRDPRTRSIPVVVLTSSKEDRDVAEAYRLGVNSYIVKPVDFSSFVEAVGKVGLYWMVVNEAPKG